MNMVCAGGLHQIRLEEMMGWIYTVVLLSAALCLWLPNEALLIQIRVNDYLIIPILKRALSPSMLSPVNLQQGNSESMPHLGLGRWMVQAGLDL